ncbi:2-amino-4-hydroxy-6-hydroxymethyldihydropteridine diphosphokinase [Metabacillus fastidiosus]|uniref:2-amino-4-hydroxy-6-hydroxymethyldihydropteridine diphosphokinase n=1 Tax=Metabacillus fastidiosus TaxID=1458 RepID=A0ABU6P6I5_9BACI|nr:2-amino-4-hydroxy-6-hydroxymethyldihydropteridine diphosphokinase [Metabacillus fastidiosus]MED4404139.1 2-amino-4-hydroxy-6-hydroxymethyldihydropteridine diphosphokinase [Metabacillus fastidiosus]MED4455548.1 2-amino-4-hydroxy-6-hydroxymethyldihydropteridine diphosphokinase [Metabacillus fastidiosus]MED4464690.1 2-amino-4-hydroxy-6-hydroxymethyldihydropteridine diphosphokinase [Metabacillus fastidiosus]
MKFEAYLALGSNMGDREFYLMSAIKELQQYKEISIENISSIYETDPIGYTDQDQFLNMVIQIKTNLTAFDLLNVTQQIEKELGRKREVKWGPRTLDLDILLYNNENIEAEHLIVPHPRMLERSFVLIPLKELNPDINIPNNETSISVIIDQLLDKKGVRIWKQKNGEDVFALIGN